MIYILQIACQNMIVGQLASDIGEVGDVLLNKTSDKTSDVVLDVLMDIIDTFCGFYLIF